MYVSEQVDHQLTKAKFVKKTQTLKVTVPRRA